MSEAPRLLIAGPTASGKSALALELAARTGGAIVNADAMQVYRDLRVLTARPTLEDEARAPHRLFGSVDGAENFSVGRWLDAVRPILAEARPLILVGGTGLYFKALTQGLSDIPAVPEEVRARVRAEAQGLAPHELHERLAARDPLTAARLRPTDPQRVVRAWEVWEATGRPLLSFQQARRPPVLPPGSYAAVFLAVDRSELNARIAARFRAMVAGGALEEVAALAKRGLDPALPLMRAHGVPALVAHLRGEMALEDAIARGVLDTRRYAKRQWTFARHQLPDFRWVGAAEAAAHLLG